MDWMPPGRRAALMRLETIQRPDPVESSLATPGRYQARSGSAFTAAAVGSDWQPRASALVGSEQRRFGRLRRVHAAAVWDDPDPAIVSWLAEPETIALLGRTLSLNLVYVPGPARMAHGTTLVVREGRAPARPVVIGSWHGPSTHGQLAELLATAAAEDDVRAIIWICGDFRPEQRKALTWLDSVTAPGTSFHAVELELWAIDDSNLAPRFRLV